MSSSRAVVLALLVLGSSPIGIAQAPLPAQTTTGAAALRGRVVDETSSPVGRARIAVAANGMPLDAVFADAEGRFEIRLPETDVTITVSKAGFVKAVVQRPARSSGSLDIRLVRGAMLTGRVVDSAGETVVNVRVRVRALNPSAPDPSILPADLRTNDRGEYRIASLAPGRYAISTEGRPEPPDFMTRPGESDQLRQMRAVSVSNNPTSNAIAVDAKGGVETDTTIVYHEVASILPYAVVGGVITGRLIDESGDPAEGVTVRLWKANYNNGQPVAEPFGDPLLTDDRGLYRLFHIPAGKYLVGATEPPQVTENQQSTLPTVRPDTEVGGGMSMALPVYYPGRTTLAEALTLRVGRGQELASVDMVFTRVRGARVSGVVLDSTGRPFQESAVILTPSYRPGAIALPPRRGSVGANGIFEFGNVPPGQYALTVRTSGTAAESSVMRSLSDARFKETLDAFAKSLRTSPPEIPDTPTTRALAKVQSEAKSEFGMQYVTVDGDDVGPVTITTSPILSSLAGRVVFDGVPPAARVKSAAGLTNPAQFVIRGLAADTDFLPATSGRQEAFIAGASINMQEGTFKMGGLIGGVRLVLTTAPPGWWLKSAIVGSTDAARDPVTFRTSDDSREDLTIVLADSAATITGGVVDEQGRPADDYWAIVFPVDRDQWFIGSPRVKTAGPGAGGRFAVTSLPPGEYWVAAVDSIEGDSVSGDWQSPDLLNRLPTGARRVIAGEGQRVSTELRLVRLVR